MLLFHIVYSTSPRAVASFAAASGIFACCCVVVHTSTNSMGVLHLVIGCIAVLCS